MPEYVMRHLTLVIAGILESCSNNTCCRRPSRRLDRLRREDGFRLEHRLRGQFTLLFLLVEHDLTLTSPQTPLDPNQAYTLASSFITSCPSSNPSLPVRAFPSLALTIDGPPRPGTTLELSSPALSSSTTNSPTSTTLYAGFLNGQNATLVPLDDDLTVTIPEGLLGTVYVVVTNSSTGVDDAVTVAGPAILDLAFDSRGQYAPTRF